MFDSDNAFKFMKITTLKTVIINLLICCSLYISAQEPKIFQIVKKGDIDALKTYLDTSKASINVVNAKGYSPLHVLIDHFVDYRGELGLIDKNKAVQNVEQSDSYRNCIRLLLDKGASAKQLTPEGWTALQYAVIKGKWQPVDQLLNKTNGGDVRDEDGNTLLHLSILVNPEEEISENFWGNLINSLQYKYKITITTPNSAGQTPIAFYMSHPRCRTNICGTAKTNKMLDNFIYHEALMVPDFSGKTAMDYAKIHNSWAEWKLNNYMNIYKRVQADWDAHMKKFDQQVELNKRKIQEYESKKAAESKQGSKSTYGCNNTCYNCHGFGSGKEKAVEVECPVCYGRGTTGYSKSEIGGYEKNYTYLTPQTCYKCNGSGRRTVYEQQSCSTCRGSGCLD